MLKLSKLNETIFGDMIKRSYKEDEVRKEDGKYVKTCLGNTVLLKNFNSNYDELIKDILSPDNEYEVYINRQNDKKDPYTYQIFDGKYGTSLFIHFSSYIEILEFMLDSKFMEEYPEEDYNNICECIATKLTEIGDCFEYIPSKNVYLKNGYSSNASKYKQEYKLLLIDESSVYYYLINLDDDYNDYLDDFIDYIKNEFPELDEDDFICWAYRDGVNIAIDVNYNNIMNIKKYREFSKNYFK